ncbi:hypothetical protein LEN26_009200 [Aphanomyces euteiches]|nr:hypothetical protein AeMF1_007373 [Aphanomyces euteiches]KAH9120501.1 hypothetical protein AeMF1_007386 [Aphanomyces euteiches]KAH9127798.1 hypothetical protein LEN26_009200 [Aphanomyces euteiches]KAH9193013.1 hypothetical protein AeNC1_005013 [Aphanomyces euteiches]
MTTAAPPRKRLGSDDIMTNISNAVDGFRRRINPGSAQDPPSSPQSAPTTPVATEASECSVCLCSLGLLKFKYVCKNCDKTVCGAHSKHQIPLPAQGLWKEVRVCDVCYENRLKRRAGAIEVAKDAPDDSSLVGILFSGLVDEQDDTLDEMLYLGSLRMGSRSLASRNFNPNIAIWIERMVMLTPAELLSFKPQKDKDKEDFLLGIGEVRTSIHMTDILHIDVDENYPRILTIVRSDGRIFRLRAKDADTCAEITKKLQEAMQMFQAALHKLQRGLRPEDNSVTCVTIQDSPRLDERVVRRNESDGSFALQLYPSSIVRVYATSPYVNGVAVYTTTDLLKQRQRCENTHTLSDDHELVVHVDCERVPTEIWTTYREILVTIIAGATVYAWADHPWLTPYLFAVSLGLTAVAALVMSSHWRVMLSTWQMWVPQQFKLKSIKVDCIKTAASKALLGKDVQVDPRFIDACKGNMEEAKRKYSKFLAWREENAIDTILLRPHPNFKVIKESFTQVTHKYDKQGHMIAIELLGNLKKGMQHFLSHGISEEDVVVHYAFYNEFMWRVLDSRPHPDGLIFKIIDMQALSMGDCASDVVNFAKKCSAVGEQYYPERLYKIFIVNPPSWFNMAWKAVSPMINQKTRDKIHVVRGQKEIQKALLEYIDAENLPEIYGGMCTCSGGGCLTDSPDELLLRDYVDKLNSNVDCTEELKRLETRTESSSAPVAKPATTTPTTKRK